RISNECPMNSEKFTLRARLAKSGEMIYFSQLDINRILERALRRSGLPLYYTQGFSPRVKLSFGIALKLGIAGVEDVTFYFTRPVAYQICIDALQPQLPEGLTLLSIDPGRVDQAQRALV
ncbi:MAG: TIGR03936 family radical SAM-associated protein, partial [Candidatus Omnitrophica bacterium]|nr:TIGR03936 family radical SAM-associated protein [Candidatus Omnitrophota bacterium]